MTHDHALMIQSEITPTSAYADIINAQEAMLLMVQ